MKAHLYLLAGVVLLLCLSPRARSGLAYPDPTGGWNYIFNANAGEDQFGDDADFDALDGTWSHTNGSDVWEGSAPGGDIEVGVNAPGGAAIYEEDGVSFLRIQDTGDPRDYGFDDPSNRKIYFGHDISQDGAPDDALDQGVTISFRARIPTPAKTTHPLDSLYRDGQGAAGPQPYPAGGDGYVTSDGGKGNFVIKQLTGGAFAFSLAVADDQGQGDPTSPKAGFTGLTMNEFNGNVISGNVNFGQGTGTNVLSLDPTEWHEFWIVLRKDPANIGTHEALIYVDGSTDARFFKITAGDGDDYSGIGYLAMGSTATPQNSALDVDFYGFKTEAVFPPGALANLPPAVLDLTPARGTRYAAAADGLKFTAVTQAPNAIDTTGARLLLNGNDVSADLVAAGDARSRSFAYSKLQPNQLYVGSIIVTDQAGRSSTNSVAFDTFVQDQVASVPFTDYSVDTDVAVGSGAQQLYLLAGSTAPQTIRVEEVTGQSTRLLGVFRVRNTGALTSPEFTPLSDALGQPVPLTGTGAGITLRLTQVYTANSTPAELLSVPTSASPPTAYIGLLVPPPDSTGVLPDTLITAELLRGSGDVDSGSAQLFLNDADVSAQATQNPGANGVTVSYTPADFLAGGSTASARVRFTTGGAPIEGAWSFAVATVPQLKASWATDVSSVSGKPRGFTGHTAKARDDADGTLFPNSPERAADQLANKIIDPDTGEPFVNEAAGENNDGSFVETGTINYEQTGLEVGIPGDLPFPNVEAGDPNYIALEVITYLNLSRGSHRLAVACDDGFAVWSGPSAAGATNQYGIRSPGGSTTETAFDVLAPKAGVYAFRLVYWEGDGGADVEWYTINPATGERVLVNADGGVEAYQSRTGDGTDEGSATAPALAIRRDGGNVVLTWPADAEGFQVQTSPTLSPASWTVVAGSGGTPSFTITIGAGTSFYRLVSP